MAFDIPTDIDFDVAFEPTKLDDKKYVINATTGETACHRRSKL
jgi:hypothetical protein